MILIVDNYDSFTYNLYQIMGELENDVMVERNNKITLEEIKRLSPEAIVLSPGPGNPNNTRDFGICTDIIQELGNDVPILGVCLGHQGIFASFGGKIVSSKPVHGKTSAIFHNKKSIFKGLKNPFIAARYHSLLCNYESIPECLEVTAETVEGLIMGIEHKYKPIIGLQFHPESVGTDEGIRLLENFIGMRC